MFCIMFFSERTTVVSTTSGYARLFSCIIRTSTAIRRGGCIKSWHLFAPKNPQYQSNETSAMAFFAYIYTGSFPVYVCDTRTQAEAKSQEDKNCFITPCEYLLLRRVVACPNRDDATKYTSWVNVACVVCVKGEYTQRFNCSHTRVRYSIVTQFASVLVCS